MRLIFYGWKKKVKTILTHNLLNVLMHEIHLKSSSGLSCKTKDPQNWKSLFEWLKSAKCCGFYGHSHIYLRPRYPLFVFRQYKIFEFILGLMKPIIYSRKCFYVFRSYRKRFVYCQNIVYVR